MSDGDTYSEPAEGAVAVIGAACRFPGAPDLDAYWSMLRSGAETLTRFEPDELRASAVPEHLVRDPDYVPVGGVLPDGELFDRSFFGYAPAEARALDPQHRVLLECATHALDHASIDPQRFPGWIAIFAGCDAVPTGIDFDDPSVMRQLIGTEKDFLATRISYKLGLRGPAMTVQTACSTSLVTAHLAAQSLLNFECDVALAGGVSLRLPQPRGYLYRAGDIFAKDGHCRPFTADASGTVPSAGAGLVVLRRLDDAVRDGNHILAVIRGSALTNDGSEKIGYTAPSPAGQRDAILLALGQAGVDPEDIAHLEAHGTGTDVGDAVEVSALTAAYRQGTERTGYCVLSSVKANIGHTGAAAGVAGLIKSVLVLHRGEVVPPPHPGPPNPKLELDTSPFRLGESPGPLTGGLAAVSSFGIGGTNAHAVLEAAPRRTRGRGPAVYCLSAPSGTALRRARHDLADRLAEQPPPAEVAWTLLAGRRRFAHRFTVDGRDTEAAADALRNDARPATFVSGGRPSVAFLFSGQGALYAGAAAAAHQVLPVFRQHLDEAISLSRREYGVDLAAMVDASADDRPLRTSLGQQLGLFGIGYAMGREFLGWEVRPTMLLGHSAGEYAAAAVAGVWDLAAGLRVVGERALAMADAPAGGLLAVYALPETVEPYLIEWPAAAVATFGPGQTVLAGPSDVLAALAARLSADRVRVAPVDADRAFHTAHMLTAGDRLAAAVSASRPRAPDLPVLSNLTGDVVTPDRLTDPAYWVDHLSSPVLLTAGMTSLLRGGVQVAIELGPGSGMLTGLRQHPDFPAELVTIPMLGGVREERAEALHRALGGLWSADLDVRWAELFPVRANVPVPPTVLEPQAIPQPAAPTTSASRPDTEADAELTTWRWIGTGTRRPDVTVTASLDSHPTTGAVVGLVTGTEPGLPAAPGASLADLLADAAGRGAIAVHTAEDTDVDRLDEILEEAHGAGVSLVLAAAGRGGLPDDDRPDLVAWAEHRSRAGRLVEVLDVGTAELPSRPPQREAECVVYAWRFGRWLARAATAAPVVRGAITVGPLLVVSDELDTAFDAVDVWGAAGAQVVGTVDLGPPQPSPPLATLTEHLRWTRRDSLTGRPDVLAAVDDLGAALVVELLVARGLLNGPASSADLAAAVDPAGRFPRLAERIARAPRERGMLTVDDDRRLAVTTASAERVRESFQAPPLAEVRGLAELIRHCVAAYPAVFGGELPPHAVLYHDGSDEQLNRWLADTRIALTDEQPCLDALAEIVARRSAGRPLRILEIGGGRGDLTWRIADLLGAEADVDYCFTDVSGLQVRKAVSRARQRGITWLRGGSYDLTADPVTQGFAVGTYDLVLGFNVVHVAPDVPVALRRLGRLLRTDGLLGLVELTKAPLWTHLVYGLLPGWWDYADDLRSDSLHLDEDAWRRALARSGFDGHVATATRNADHAVVLGGPAGEHTPVAQLNRQLAEHRPATLVRLASNPAHPSWPEIRDAARRRGVRRTLVLTQDKEDWDEELSRGQLDPVDEAPLPWHHLRVTSFTSNELARLPELLAAADLPATARWRPTSAPYVPDTEAPATPPPTVPAPAEARPSPDEGARDVLAGLWRENLGVATVDDEDDFFRLGGDSLALVHLLGEVHRSRGVRIETAHYLDTPTFGRLVELVDDQHPQEEASIPGLLPLSRAGTGTPLFLCAPATGSSLCYRHIAPLLGVDRPVFGLDIPFDHKADIPDIATSHAALIRRVRPEGPCLVGGWSAGFALAHEVTARLESTGTEVGLLISFDGLLPDTHGLPFATRPGEVARALWLLARTRLAGSASLAKSLRLAHASGDLAKVPGIEQVARTLTGEHDLVRAHNRMILAMLRYRPRPVRAPAVVCKAGVATADAKRMAARVTRLYSGGIVVVPAPGDHWRVIDAEFAGPVSAIVRAELATRGL